MRRPRTCLVEFFDQNGVVIDRCWTRIQEDGVIKPTMVAKEPVTIEGIFLHVGNMTINVPVSVTSVQAGNQVVMSFSLNF
jgi:hypothetical protein